MTASSTMTSDAKRALAKAIRGLRTRLITDLGEATERAYRLSVADAGKAQLDEAARVKRARLEGWIDEQVRALPKLDAKGRAAAAQRLRDDVVKDAAATLLLRIVYLRLLEASGLSAPKVVTGGWDSRGYKDFREAAPELVRADETEGYAALLRLMFDELAVDLPGLFGDVGLTRLVPVPAAALRAVVERLDDDELASCGPTTPRSAGSTSTGTTPTARRSTPSFTAGKIEPHEIASKTQMFTERYMVEWLLQNSLGLMWLACASGTAGRPTREQRGLARLEERRIGWRARARPARMRASSADTLMPLEPGLEARWAYYVPQPIPDDAVTQAPEPACATSSCSIRRAARGTSW
jgi:hypothetical protein